MDKKNFLLGIMCLALAFGLMVNQERRNLDCTKSANDVEAEHKSCLVNDGKAVSSVKKADTTHKITANTLRRDERTFFIENDYIRVYFTNIGGAISRIDFKKYKADISSELPYAFNVGSELTALNLSFNLPSEESDVIGYEVSAQTDNFVQFSTKLVDGTEIVRGYKLPASSDKNPYLIKHETAINSVKSPHFEKAYINLGVFPSTAGDSYGEYLNFGAYDGRKAEFIKSRDFAASSGFLGFGKREARAFSNEEQKVVWGSIKNQFFTAILTPNVSANGYFARPVDVVVEGKRQEAINGFVEFDITKEQNVFAMTYYVGPKDYVLLNRMGDEQDLVMQFGFFGGISKVLLLSMIGIHSFVNNWGWTIILLTLFIKLLMWPLTNAQMRSSKRMASIQLPLKQIREKYKNNPQKAQMETMKLFKESKVNPAMGCLPVLVQLPIFLGLYFMLRTSSEMRLQSFLWIKDLSVSDTIAHIGSFPVNILPLLMGITMFFQMKATPTPTMDNAQQKILQWMPFIFLVFCYSFPAALVLYCTIKNLLTILQQYITNRSSKMEPATEIVIPQKKSKMK